MANNLIFLMLSIVLLVEMSNSQAPEEKHHSLLFEAILDSNYSFIKQILECGWENVNGETAFGLTGLMQAAILGKNSVVELLLEHGANIDSQSGTNKWTALMFSISYGWHQTTQLLLNKGANVNVHGKRGSSPFLLAGQDEVARKMLASFSNVTRLSKTTISPLYNLPYPTTPARSMVTVFGETAISAADQDKNKNTREEVVHPLLSVVVRGYIPLIRSLINAGADVNFQNERGISPLMLASFHGYGEITKILLRSGANIELKDNYGWTALMFAVSKSQTGIIEILLDNGANINTRSKTDATPLMLAAIQGYHVSLLLIDKGANVNDHDVNGATPFSFAADSGNLKTVELLATNGAWVDPRKTDGGTPLMFAAQQGNIALARTLLTIGVDVEAQSNDKSTALMYAAFANNREMVRVLIENGNADISATNTFGLTASDYATDASIKNYLIKPTVMPF